MTTEELLQEKDKIIRQQAEMLRLMSEQIDELKKAVELYRQAATLARAARFGSKSEKTMPEGCEEQYLFNEAETEASPKAAEPDCSPDSSVDVKGHKRKKRGSREEMLKDIPHEEKICELPEDRMDCDVCGTRLVPVGKKHVRTEVQRIPAQIKIIDYYQMIYKCPGCEKDDTPKMTGAPVPQPVLQHSMVSASAAAHVLLQKYQNATPLYRQEAEWAELEGLPGAYGGAVAEGPADPALHACGRDAGTGAEGAGPQGEDEDVHVGVRQQQVRQGCAPRPAVPVQCHPAGRGSQRTSERLPRLPSHGRVQRVQPGEWCDPLLLLGTSAADVFPGIQVRDGKRRRLGQRGSGDAAGTFQ